MYSNPNTSIITKENSFRAKKENSSNDNPNSVRNINLQSKF